MTSFFGGFEAIGFFLATFFSAPELFFGGIFDKGAKFRPDVSGGRSESEDFAPSGGRSDRKDSLGFKESDDNLETSPAESTFPKSLLAIAVVGLFNRSKELSFSSISGVLLSEDSLTSSAFLTLSLSDLEVMVLSLSWRLMWAEVCSSSSPLTPVEVGDSESCLL